MKFILSTIFTLLFFITATSQEVFKYDKYGIVADKKFKKLIKDRDYELVGDFHKISQKSKKIYAKILKDGKWGYLNLKGQEIIEPNYQELKDFKNGVSIVAFKINQSSPFKDLIFYDGNYGLINEEGALLTKHNYNYITTFHNDYAIAYRNKKSGIINKKGVEVTSFSYRDIKFDEDFWFVRKDKKWGLLNKNRKLVIPFKYDYIRRFNGFLLGYKENKFTILNSKTGKRINKSWYDAMELNDYNTPKNSPRTPNKNVLVVKQEDSFFLINKKGEKISDNYKHIFQESKKYFRVKKEKKFGIINDEGKVIIKLNFDLAGVTNDKNIFYCIKDGKTYYYNKDFKKLPIPSSITDGPNFKNGLGFAKFDSTMSYKAGFVNYKYKLVIPAIYDGVSSGFENKNEALVRKNMKWGVINRKGKIIIPFKYDYITKAGEFYVIRDKGKKGIIDSKNNIIIPIIYQNILYCNDKNYIVKLDDKFGIINLKNQIVVPIEYDYLGNDSCFSEGLLKVEKNNLYGFVNSEGKVVIPIQYQYIDDFSNGFATGRYNDKEVIIDKYGNIYWR